MRLATLRTGRGERLHVRGRSGYVDVADALGDDDLGTLLGYLRAGDAARSRAADLAELAGRDGNEAGPSDFAPLLPEPRRILCVGVNYSEHAIEGGREVPNWPEAFVRGAPSVIGPYDDMVKPALSERFDYEGELALVVGRGGRYIFADRALDALAGVTILNDGSAREWQRRTTQWTAGKNFDATLPLGPELVSLDEVDVTDLRLTTRLNGEVMQSASTAQMIVDVRRCVEFFSSFTTLQPGDLIATGTPGGVGFARTPPVWLQPGDTIEVEIGGVGTIRNRLVAEKDAPADWPWQPLA